MEKRQKVLEMRKRLDKTLASHDLTNEESIKVLVKDQLLRSPFNGTEEDVKGIVEKRSLEVSNFLQMLRSASDDEKNVGKGHRASHNEWKVKQDTDEVRVMYREGPHGTPFHTLLVEGCIDGPIDVCLCVSWESSLYTKWWPQYNVPTFKITNSSRVQDVRIGEEISLVRVKVPWPVSDREALLHYFEIEFFKEDLVLVLLNTISHTENIDLRTHGFTRDGIPEAKDIVRVDLIGGFALQKVSPNRSYFRNTTIANMDIKLDFVPPWLINFISRQLIGNGYKLYQKAVRSVGTTDGDYSKALTEPMYMRIREHLESKNKEQRIDLPTSSTVQDNTNASTGEIVEEEPLKQNPCLVWGQAKDLCSRGSENREKNVAKEGRSISPEVVHALRILDKAIAAARQPGIVAKESAHTDSLTMGNAAAMNRSSNGIKKRMPADVSWSGNDMSQGSEKLSILNNVEEGDAKDNAQNGKIDAPVKQARIIGSSTVGKVFDAGSLNGSEGATGFAGGKVKRKRRIWKFGHLSLGLL